MKSGLVLIPVAIFASFILISCSSMPSSPVMCTDMNNGSTLNLPKDGIFKISLKGNPTTGYIWEVSKCDPQLIKLTGTEYTRDSDLCGAGGVYEWTFQVVGKGNSTIEFIYHRPWEKNEKPIKNFKLMIQSDYQ